MARYLALWELESTRIPVDRTERGAGWAQLMAGVRDQIEDGLITSWGAFIGGERGYAVYEGSEIEVMNALQLFVPFARFDLHPAATEGQTNEMIASLSS